MVNSAEGLVVRQSVHVPLGTEEAFRLFTERVAQWWPLASHSVSGDAAAGVVFEPRRNGSIVETSAAGETSIWGTITTWEPPHRLGFTWHPGDDAQMATQVEISFAADEAGMTRVELVHTGWEVKGERAAAAVESYGPGWELVLGKYVELAGVPAP